MRVRKETGKRGRDWEKRWREQNEREGETVKGVRKETRETE